MIKKDGLQTAAEERQRQSKEFRTETARQSIPKRRTNNGKAPALGRSQPNPNLTVVCNRPLGFSNRLLIPRAGTAIIAQPRPCAASGMECFGMLFLLLFALYDYIMQSIPSSFSFLKTCFFL